MPRYLVEEKREYTERWIIDAETPDDAKFLKGTLIDHDAGYGGSFAQSVVVSEVADDHEDLGL